MADWRDTDWANLIPGERRYDEEKPQYYDNGDNGSAPVAEPTQQVDYQQPQAVEPVDQEAFWGSEERVSGNYWTPSRIMSLDNQANWITDDATSGAGHYENSDLITANVDHKQIHDTAQYLNAATQGQYSWDDDYWKDHNWRTDNETWNNYVKNWEVPADYVAQTETNAVQAEQVQSPTTTPQVNNQVADTGAVTPQTTTTTPTATGTNIDAGVYHVDGGNISYGSMNELVNAMDTDYRNSGLANDKQTTMLNVDKTGANYNNLDTYGKITYNTSSGQTGSVENSPEYSEYTQGVKQAVMSASGPGQAVENLVSMFAGNKIGKVAGGATTAVTALFMYGANKGWWEMPDFAGKGLELFDLGDTLGSQFYGKFALAYKQVTGHDLSDASQIIRNYDVLLSNIGDVWGAYKGGIEGYDSDLVDMITKYSADTMTAIGGGAISRLDQNVTSTLLGSDYYLEKGQVTRSVLGLDGVYTLEDGTYGEEGLKQWLDIAQNLRNMGYNDAQIEAYVSHKMYEYYGDYSELAQTNEHEAMDISNYTNGVYARALQGVGKVTGDVNLQNAAKANTGDVYSDVLHNFLPSNMQRVVQQALTTVSNGTIHESGGINDIKDVYDMENVYGDLDKVTNFGKRFSGIQEDGTLKGTFTPNQNETVSQRMKSFFSETNESKMYSEADTIINVLNTALDDALRARGNEDPTTTAQRFETLVTELTDPDAIGENSPLAGIKNTAIFQTIKSDIASGIGKNADTLRGYVAQFQNTANNRVMLNNVAEALGMSAAEVITQFNEKPDTIKKTIADAVTKNGGTLGKIAMPDVLTAEDFANKVQQTVQPFVGKDGVAWDARLLGMQMSTKMFDGIQDTLMGKYEVKSKNALYRFGDTIRALQSLILLGLSPTYVANNLTNNIATRYTLGYGGFLTQKVIDDWNDRWGFKSARAEVSEGEYGDMSKDGDSLRGRLHSKVKDKTTVKDWMNTVKEKAQDWNKNIGVFSKLSNAIEGKESDQIMNMACRTYMARTWKEGVNYRKMDPYLENLMGEDMTKAVYAAINSSVNQAEIEDAIFGTYMKPSIHESIADAARQAGIDNPEEYVNEVFVKTGLEEKLRSKLSGLQGENEIKTAVDEIRDYARNFAEYKYRSDLISKAEAVENIVTGEGVSAVYDQMINAQNEFHKLTENWRETMYRLYAMHKNMTNEAWSKEYTKARAEYDARYQQLYDMNTQALLGIVNGLGLTDDSRKKYKSILVDAMQKKQNGYMRMYSQQKKAWDVYKAKLEGFIKVGYTGGALQSQQRAAWREYNATMDTINQKVVDIETKQNQRFNTALEQGFKTSVSKRLHTQIDQFVMTPLKQADEIRARISEIEYQLRLESRKKEIETEGTESRMWDARNEVYNEYKAELQQLRAQENKLRTDAYKAMKEISQKSPDIEAEEAAAYNQEDYDIAARIAVLQQEAEQVKKENTEYVKQVESDMDENGEYAFGDSTWFSGAVSDRLTTRNLRKIATKAGATEKQAQEYAVFMTTLKQTYEEKHKGENFWDKIKLRVDFVPEVGQTNENGETLRAMFDYKAGENIVTIFKNGDLSSLIHETMHAVTSILDEDQRADLASWNGISAEHFDELQNKYLNGESLTADEKKEWSNVQEKFAYGFEEYLRSDKAPTVGIRTIFATVKTFFINLYENLKDFIGGVDPNEERNGVRLADIFESLITVEREQEQAETVTEPAPQQMTIDDAPKVELVEQVVEQPKTEKTVKKEPDTNGAIYGNEAEPAHGNKDVKKIYEFVYKIIDLDKLIPSHTIVGTTINWNPAYKYSQPRLDRGTMSALQDVIGKAIDMQPDMMIDERGMIGKGTPIVTEDNMVADGNGRAMMMKFARDNKYSSWTAYQKYLHQNADKFGFDAEEIDNFKNPVLVRELKTDVTPNDFAQDANTATAMRYTAYETAMQDAKTINVKSLWGKKPIGRNTDTAKFLATKKANDVIKSFLEANPGDRASYVDGKGVLNDEGVDRIVKALFANVFGENAEDMVRVASMMHDTSGVKKILTAFSNAIPQIGNVRARVLEGFVGENWDVATTLGAGERAVYNARRSKPRMEITEYINQGGIDGPLPNKVRATAYFLSSFSNNTDVIEDFAREYSAQTVKNAPNQKQRDLFGNLPTEPTPEQILESAFNAIIEKTKDEGDKNTIKEAINILNQENVQLNTLFQYDYTNRTVKPSEIDPAKIQARKVQPNYKLVEQMMNVAEKYNMRMLGASIISAYVEGKDVGKLEGDLKTLANLAEVSDELEMIWSVQNGENNISQTGYSVKPIVEQQINGQTIKAKIYHDGELVALIPNELPVTEVTIDDDVKCKVVGIDPNNPEAVVIATPNETLITIDPSAGRENKMKSEAFRPEMDVDSMPTIDPEGEATAEINFEQIIPILERLSGIYAGKIDSAMTSNKYGNLTPEGQRLLREYIDYVVRQDLASTKFKATKFSEMMRDAALLNYDKRYGFDNFLTFLSPYQFWQTRSAANWLRRLNDRKHLFNRYFRLKEMATKREKDFLPSRVEGMYGLPIYGLPDWMGSRVFFNTQQEVPIAGFLDPILESAEESSVLEASAKKILGDWVEAGTITSEQYTLATNDHNNEKWKEAMAQAEIENPRTHDTASVLQDYLGLSLPASWIKAGMENDPSALSQLPSTKFGNALGATFTTESGNTAIDKIGDFTQFVASLPERGMHAVMKGAFGDEFEYKKLGSYGDYYIDQQLFYMVMEGKITTDQMLLAMEQRDGNEVYEKAYDRAREQVAMKTPGYASVASIKNFGSDMWKWMNGDESVSGKDVVNDMLGTLESFALSPKGLYIVSEGESKMREKMDEQDKAYASGTQNQFFKDNPEMSYKNLQYMTDDPEGRYRTWCYKNITNIYYSMNDDERKNVCMALGEDFENAIGVGGGSKETRCYETVDLKKLTGWTQALMGETPYMNNSDYGQEAEKYNYTPLPEQTLNEIQLYKKQKDEMFPNIAMVETNYWRLAPELRDDYVARFPELDNMWKWTEQYKETHSEYDAWTGRKRDYYNQREADKAFKLMSNLTLNAFRRNDVTSDYYGEIRRIQQQIGNTDDIEKFVQELQDYYIG